MTAPTSLSASAQAQAASEAVNALGVELYEALAGKSRNSLLSPLSIQVAMAMAFAGAAGDTRAEMERVLHLPGDDTHAAFAALTQSLVGAAVRLDLANRIFVQRDYSLRQEFLGRAPADPLDFRQTAAARAHINAWVEHATHDKIRDLIPPDLLDEQTRLVLVNALYLRAAWATPFHTMNTQQEDFFVDEASPAKVPTMIGKVRCGFANAHGAELVALPFVGEALRFVAFVPKRPNDAERFRPEWLQGAAQLPMADAIVHLPKFRVEPPALALSRTLCALGLETTFDHPPGSANFDAMAPRRADDYLFLSEVVHKTFLALDEEGVEAAAATALAMPMGAAAPRTAPPVIRIDRPFFFAVQHVHSGACLFLGRITDPRGGA